MDKKIGHYSFIGAVVLAIVLGVLTPIGVVDSTVSQWLVSLLVVLGLIVGFLNISTKEKKEFMMVATVLIIASFAGGASNVLAGVQIIGEYLSAIFQGILAVVIPALVVVGLKDVWDLGKNE